MDVFAGGRMTLEGDLSRCFFPEGAVVERCDAGGSVLDSAELRLEPSTLDAIFKGVMAAGLRRAVVHVRIESGGILQVGAYDNFHSECVVTGPGVSKALLDELLSAGMLWNYREADVELQLQSDPVVPPDGPPHTAS